MIVKKINGIWCSEGRGYGKPNIEVVRGDRRWDVYELRADGGRVQIAADLSFAEARHLDSPERLVLPKVVFRTTRVADHLHQFGPISVAKSDVGWAVLCGDAVFGTGLPFPAAKRLAGIEERKHALHRFRLAMAFVPYATRNENLRKRLTSQAWRRVAKEAYLRAEGVCQTCNTHHPRLECHEWWEYDDLRYIQRLARLASVCTLCHQVIHYNNAYKWTGDCPNLIEHFKRVNGADAATTWEHLRTAEWLYQARSGRPWVVDYGKHAVLLAASP